MEKAKQLLDELKTLMNKNDEQSKERRNEIATWFKDHRTPEIEEKFMKFMEDGLAEIATEIQDVRKSN